ncbi:hypothetical protein [Caulobacter sp. 17J65-9]|uniref:hypothetical protein n=1 Tax=Caulobacter sp. 17J65-9 TaxID=2709382 RepID=UPI0013C91A85|nr:hypothetical protein [Caulobacter sp. 17J65-9]NEX94025.1 hypothetical protein [Caulobacter sp. 17J65-9]
MNLRLASLLLLAAALASCRDPNSNGRDKGPFGELTARGERAFSAVSGRGGDYYDESVSPYERGIRDGLRDAEFNRDERSAAYRRGYDAGRRELQRDRQAYQANDSYYGDQYATRGPARTRAPAANYASDTYGYGNNYSYGDSRSDYATGYSSRDDYYASNGSSTDYRRVTAGASVGSRGVPSGGMRACADEVERVFGLRQGSAQPVSARPRDNGGYEVDVRANGRHAVCRLNADGQVKGVDER